MIIDIGNKKKFKQVTITLGISIILLLFNILFEIIPPPKITPKLQLEKHISTTDFNLELTYLFDLFRIDTVYLDKFNYIDKDNNVYQQINITISPNFPQIIFLREIYNLARQFEMELKVTEEKIRGNTNIKIYENNKMLYLINLKIDKKLSDQITSISIICAANKLSNDDIELIESLPFKVSFAILPTENNFNIISNITTKKFHYGILISDNIKDYKFLLTDGMNLSRLKSSVFNINNSFNNARYVLFDNYSKIMQSKTGKIISEEFVNFQILPYNFTELNILKEGEDKDIKSMFKYIVTKNFGKSYLLLISLNDFYNIYDDLYIYYLKGVKYEYPNVIYNKSDSLLKN
ncbi:MAG TPA: hypothetical protein PLI27_07165 [Ignavibacteriales bacterium]|nr:hypothetical protein [Ignavibacteriales bacterium]HOL81540.1 hypothetical protein [Ignavibacteriales bacterium]HOM65630.1 hypothetical protein [Ignavibacteriales bacterium]HPD67838.1 hypothetical protein [Ignavibacteriales bacterium]HPP33654.1 hypothetical protein [Ignavibacteriales bacterium]